jgi:hypothetical protein
MNSRFFTAALILLAGLFIATSCGKDDEEIRTQIENNITQGTWRITNFDDSNVDKTDNFTGFNFTFGDNGTLTATNGVLTYTGTWSITDGDENDDILDDLDFNISFAQVNEFGDLNDDWDIFAQSATKLELTEAGGISDTDLLTFTKN